MGGGGGVGEGCQRKLQEIATLRFKYVKISPSWYVGRGMSIPNSGDSPCEGTELREVQNLKKIERKSLKWLKYRVQTEIERWVWSNNGTHDE